MKIRTHIFIENDDLSVVIMFQHPLLRMTYDRYWWMKTFTIFDTDKTFFCHILKSYNLFFVCFSKANWYCLDLFNQIIIWCMSYLFQDFGPSWSYGSWIYNYLCNQCLSPLTLWVLIPIMVRCTIQHYVINLSVTIKDLWFSPVLQFPPPPPYNWNIVESGIKHHKTKTKNKHLNFLDFSDTLTSNYIPYLVMSRILPPTNEW